MIVDMRCRPPFGTFMDDGILWQKDVLIAKSRNVYKCEASPAAVERSMDLFIQEMNEAGVDKVVAPVRVTNGGKNEVVAELLKQYPDRIASFAGVNPFDGIDAVMETIDKYVVHGDFIGVTVEPGFIPTPNAINGLTCDDHILYPIYEKCQSENIPILIAHGGLCHYRLNKFKPEMLDQVLIDFPKMKTIIAHGGYPYVSEVCWIAQKRGNLWLEPDVYVAAAGGRGYIDAARYFLQGKVMFGTAYPACTFKRGIELYEAMNMEKELYDQVMGDAAAELLGL